MLLARIDLTPSPLLYIQHYRQSEKITPIDVDVTRAYDDEKLATRFQPALKRILYASDSLKV